MKKIIIVQSIPDWVTILKRVIPKKIPEISDILIFTDSFDHAIDVVKKSKKESLSKVEDCHLLIITSDMFHDASSSHRDRVIKNIPDMLKDSNLLAKMVKGLNPDAEVYTFSGYVPKETTYLDGYILETDDDEESALKILETIQNWVVFKKMQSCLN